MGITSGNNGRDRLCSLQTKLLNREQTDEWKGWMQLVILIYHISGASVVSPPRTPTGAEPVRGEKASWFPSAPQFIPVYMHVRVLVAAYLFQTGYGHFSFFWLKGDFSLYRVCQVSLRPSSRVPGTLLDAVAAVSRVSSPRQVLFRLNFLVLVLCVVMDRPYQFYYFVPLVTFWFFIIYGTLVLWPQILQKKANSRLQPWLAGVPQQMLDVGLPLTRWWRVVHGGVGEAAGAPALYLLLCVFTGG